MTSRTFLIPQGGLVPALISDALSLANVAIPPAIVQQWTELERLIAYDWAMREHLRAGDNFGVRRRPRPHFVSVADETARAPAVLR